MKQITAITDDAKQTMTVSLDDGSQVDMTLQYIQANKGWYISLIYGSGFPISMHRVTSSPNFLRAFRNVIPFGMACVTTDKYEPIYKNDFLTGRAILFVLGPSDVAYVENTVIPAYRQ